ncbi:MAG: TIGR03668 family PPOX class F420-dependent oxidoreductase [Acidimicrobiia bacterium]
MTLDRGTALARFTRASVASLGTTRESGSPHLVPITFAVEAATVYSMVDRKPKTTTALRRLANIAANPEVSLLVDHYEDDWTGLWWVRVDGTATVSDDPATLRTARTLLQSKYPQYRDQPPDGPALSIAITGVTWWEWAR